MIRFIQREGVVAQRMGDDTVVLDSTGELLRSFNAVGAFIWESLPGDRDSILALLRAQYPDVTIEVLGKDLDQFLGDLADKALVTSVET